MIAAQVFSRARIVAEVEELHVVGEPKTTPSDLGLLARRIRDERWRCVTLPVAESRT